MESRPDVESRVHIRVEGQLQRELAVLLELERADDLEAPLASEVAEELGRDLEHVVLLEVRLLGKYGPRLRSHPPYRGQRATEQGHGWRDERR